MSTAFLLRPDKCKHNFIRQLIITMCSEVLNHPHCKPLTGHRIPLGQQDDLRCAALEIIAEFTPSTVAVCEIFVNCGGYFFAPFLLLL